MATRYAFPVAAALAALVAPLAAAAQVAGSVTTVPIDTAPALALPLICLLLLVLAGVALRQMRRTVRRAGAAVVLVAVVTVLGRLAYAGTSSPPAVTVSGADCTRQTVSAYNAEVKIAILQSDCPRPIQIVAIDSPACPQSSPLINCAVGQVLAAGGSCVLPFCDC